MLVKLETKFLLNWINIILPSELLKTLQSQDTLEAITARSHILLEFLFYP